ncbi:MAG TPA: hypothetical protein DCO67_02945 [Staphylococcus sp.]|uniref:hypothetical protein n=1 Tax=Mammaliicoccus vitulinus TaxID=71237 RepID=UPI000EE3A11D|nr:hypothetical protein [Mammaliicoccus vitulinus]HAL08907.1 hypothetical protein [Staphylococcus sp.]
MKDVIRFIEDGEEKYVESHWDYVQGKAYANTYDIEGNIQDGIVSAGDKYKYDRYIKSQGIMLYSPNGSSFLLTVSDDGELGVIPYYMGGM